MSDYLASRLGTCSPRIISNIVILFFWRSLLDRRAKLIHPRGYAVMDYRAVKPELGMMEDLLALAKDLRERGISLCVDLVVNHTAKEHEWAKRAMAGEELMVMLWSALAYALRRDHPENSVMILANFDDNWQSVNADIIENVGSVGNVRNLLAEGSSLNISEGRLYLAPYESMWLVGDQ